MIDRLLYARLALFSGAEFELTSLDPWAAGVGGVLLVLAAASLFREWRR
jgi:hypothetical protein